jgi:hypothetical protein
MTIVKGLIAGFVVLTGLMIPSIGRADTIQFDQNLSTPNGVYYGSGNVNGGFTVVQSNGIEIGLRAKLRDPSLTGEDTIIHSTTNVYTVPSGIYAPNRALWNYDFSINVNSFEGPTLPDVTATMLITDLNSHATWTVDPLSHWLDNTGWGYPNAGGQPTIITNLGGQNTAAGYVVYGAQNSENPGFSDFRTALSFVPDQSSSYQFDLTVTDGAFSATDTMIVNAGVSPAPEPATAVLLGCGVVCVGLGLRKRKIAPVAGR